MTADRRAEAERLAALPEGDRVIDITYRAAEIERALIAAENAAYERAAKVVEERWLSSVGVVAHAIRALRTDAGTDAGEETGT